jgi:nucleotide-binding universal stress UspA family protein
MIKKIMVPVAFSKYSQGILEYAQGLAAPLDAELLIVNVISERDMEAVNKISSFGYKVDSESYVATIKKERRKQLGELTEKLTLPDDKVSFSFLIGDPTDELLRCVIEEHVDLVVMGIKNKEIKHIFAGSVAERMFRRCPVPVLSYRGDDIAQRLHKHIEKYVIDH